MSDKVVVYQLDTIKNRDEILEGLWRDFGDVPINPETERIEEEFMGFPTGTDRKEIWRWFDDRHSRGVGYLMYRDATKWKPKLLEAAYQRELCEECMSETCVFNPDGICKFPMVYGRGPELGEDGCKDWVLANFDRWAGEDK